MLEQARQQLDPLAASSHLIGNIVAVLVVTGVVLTTSGFVYCWSATREARALSSALDLPEDVAV